MIRSTRLLAPLAAALALAACGDKAEETGTGSAQGEVLGGTISDAMLPLDTVRSTAPALEAEPSAGADTEAATPAPTETGSDEAEPQADQSAEPAPEEG